MEDIKIIELYLQRDELAITATDKKYGSTCRRIALDIVTDLQDSEECVNDTYLSLWNAIPPQRPKNFPAFTFRILRNISINRLRGRLAAKRGGGELELVLNELEPYLASGNSPEAEYEAKELALEIRKFLRSLAADERTIFLARYWLIMPTSMIAKRLGFSESKVRTSLHRSRNKLHRHLSEEGLI